MLISGVVWLGELVQGSLGEYIDASVVNTVAGRHFYRIFVSSLDLGQGTLIPLQKRGKPQARSLVCIL